MTLRWFVVWLIAALASCSASAAHLQFDTTDMVGIAIASRPLRLTPIDTPRLNGTTLITGERYATNTRTGSVTISNVTAGYYRGEIQGAWTNTIFILSVPSTNALLSASSCLASSASVPSGLGYTRAQIDALLAALPAGTNTIGGSYFTADVDGDLTPITGTTTDAAWETDINGDLTPK